MGFQFIFRTSPPGLTEHLWCKMGVNVFKCIIKQELNQEK